MKERSIFQSSQTFAKGGFITFADIQDFWDFWNRFPDFTFQLKDDGGYRDYEEQLLRQFTFRKSTYNQFSTQTLVFMERHFELPMVEMKMSQISGNLKSFLARWSPKPKKSVPKQQKQQWRRDERRRSRQQRPGRL